MMREISPKEVEELLAEGKSINIVDVREDEEVAQGIIPTAKHIALGSLEERVDELDENREYILVCRSGRRSAMACEFLNGQGFQVINMNGGMLDWEGPTK